MWETLSSSWAIGVYVFVTLSGVVLLFVYIFFPKIKERNFRKKKESLPPPKDQESKLESRWQLDSIFVSLDKIIVLLQKSASTVSDVADSNNKVLERVTEATERMHGTSSQLMEAQNTSNLNIQRLLQRCLEALTSLNETINSNQNMFDGESSKNDPPSKIITPEASIPIISGITVVNEIELSPYEFDELVQRNKEAIIQASSGGKRDLEILLRRLADHPSVELDCPSDQIFIIASRNKSDIHGKAFVFPGSYLGRPWVDWFEMPLGVYERVESTVMPATVSKNQAGNWTLDKMGRVSQR